MISSHMLDLLSRHDTVHNFNVFFLLLRMTNAVLLAKLSGCQSRASFSLTLR